MPDIAASIWATRLKREINLLVSSEKTNNGNKKPSAAAAKSIIPPFVSLQGHTMDVEKGICKVTFRIDIEKPSYEIRPVKDPNATVVVESTTTEKSRIPEQRIDDANGLNEPVEVEMKINDKVVVMSNEKNTASSSSTMTSEKKKEEEEEDEEAEKQQQQQQQDEGEKDSNENESNNNTTSHREKKFETEEAANTPPKANAEKESPSEKQMTATEGPPMYAMVEIDASLQIDPHNEDESSHNNYPFQKPRAILLEGASFFPTGARVTDGDAIEVDCDWTPSLHLVDAALNVILRIRESIRRGDASVFIQVKEAWSDGL